MAFRRDAQHHIGRPAQDPAILPDLVVDVPGVHPPAVERDGLFLNPGDVPLVLGDDLRLELAVPVPGDINLEFPVLALELLGGMAVALVCGVHVAFLVLFIAQCRV